jgi:hypothetical protein
MPAHITLIYPFRDSARIDAETIEDIGSVLSSFVSFTFTLTTVECFRSPLVVLYLAPEPAAPFQELTRAFARRFPDAPPYEGVFDEIIPHVKIADEEDPEILATVEAEVASRLPIEATAPRSRARRAWAPGWSLESPSGWRLRLEYPSTGASGLNRCRAAESVPARNLSHGLERRRTSL